MCCTTMVVVRPCRYMNQAPIVYSTITVISARASAP